MKQRPSLSTILSHGLDEAQYVDDNEVQPQINQDYTTYAKQVVSMVRVVVFIHYDSP